MAIFLVKDRDATHWNPVKDLRGCYKRFDLVAVYEDRPCILPPAEPFYLIKVAGLSKDDAEYLIASEWSAPVPPRVREVRRAYAVSAADIPGPILTELETLRSLGFTEIGQTAINWSPAVRNWIRRKRTGEPA